jgi:hypothetical protein
MVMVLDELKAKNGTIDKLAIRVPKFIYLRNVWEAKLLLNNRVSIENGLI